MASTRTLTWDQVWSRRLSRHALDVPVSADRLAEQVGVMCGIHAQVMSAAEVSIGVRVAGVTRADVRRALWEERSIVKTIGPRGTVHLLAADDLATWNAALGQAVQGPGFTPDISLNEAQTDAVVAAIDGALTGSDLTLEQLDKEVATRAGAWAGEKVMPAFQDLWPRWRQAIRLAAFRGALCFGPNQGAKVTYSSPRRWVVGYTPASPDVASATVLRWYLNAYGPARPEHVARWLNSTPAWAKDAFRRAGDAIERVDVEGDELWQIAGDEVPHHQPAGVRLLPYFDAYAVGCHPRERLFVGRAGERALARTQAGNYPVLLVDGLVEGVWHQQRKGKKTGLTVEPFRRLSRAELHGLEEQVRRIGEVQEAAATLSIGTISVGPHA